MNTVQQAASTLLPRSSQAGSLPELLIAAIAAWFSRCEQDRIYL